MPFFRHFGKMLEGGGSGEVFNSIGFNCLEFPMSSTGRALLKQIQCMKVTEAEN